MLELGYQLSRDARFVRAIEILVCEGIDNQVGLIGLHDCAHYVLFEALPHARNPNHGRNPREQHGGRTDRTLRHAPLVLGPNPRSAAERSPYEAAYSGEKGHGCAGKEPKIRDPLND
jgi:hypothetical protein